MKIKSLGSLVLLLNLCAWECRADEQSINCLQKFVDRAKYHRFMSSSESRDGTLIFIAGLGLRILNPAAANRGFLADGMIMGGFGIHVRSYIHRKNSIFAEMIAGTMLEARDNLDGAYTTKFSKIINARARSKHHPTSLDVAASDGDFSHQDVQRALLNVRDSGKLCDSDGTVPKRSAIIKATLSTLGN